MQKNLQKNLYTIKKKLGNSDELICKEISSGENKFAILYLAGLNDTSSLSKFVISPLLDCKEKITSLKTFGENNLPLSEISIEEKDNEIISSILKGKGVLLVDGFDKCLILSIEEYKERAIGEPPTSSVLKGPRSGFVENLKTNLAEIRKILATPSFRTINLKVGKHTDTDVTIVYIQGIADKEIVDIVKKRIEKINIDGIIDSNYVAGFLEERPHSMFKQVGNSEKPDIVCAKLLEGRVAIIVDGSPIVLTLPFIYVEDLQSGDDYYSNNVRAGFARWIRIFGIFISILIPGIYIAIVMHHYKAIPLKFLITIVNTTKGLPLTPFAEILFVIILFEILYEASLRMPKYLGLALSIVGALILGDTAVKAGLISPPAVMIVAISGLTIYCIPDEASQLYTLRLLFTFAGAFLGFFGITALMLFIIAYLCDFDSYGSAYFAPLAPFVDSDTNDAFFKADITDVKYRPLSIKNNRKNLVRQGDKKKDGKNNINKSN